MHNSIEYQIPIDVIVRISGNFLPYKPEQVIIYHKLLQKLKQYTVKYINSFY